MLQEPLDVEAFGDPFCPWDFSAEPARIRLLWRYGGGLSIRHRMIVLSERPSDYDDKGLSPEDIGRGRRMLGDRFGMPIVPEPFPRHVASVVGCRAVVGTRIHASEDHAALLLRRLRVLVMSELLLLDDPATVARAATEAGLDPAEVSRWAEDEATSAALADDMRAARHPDDVALAMPERLADTPDGGSRFTCPSYRFHRGERMLQAPGFQPGRVYEVLVANIAPHLSPRPNPDNVADVLDWAPYPLATAEVAAVLEQDHPTVAGALHESGAHRHTTLGGLYWSAA